MIPEKIRRDLRNGMSLEETLVKHNTNLQELLKNNQGFAGYDDMRNITKISAGHYRVTKTIMDRVYSFGTYETLEDAKIVREELLELGWKQEHVDDICKSFGIKRVSGWKDNLYCKKKMK